MSTDFIKSKGVKLRDPEDTATLRQDILDGALEEFKASFPKSYGGVRLEVDDLKYEGPEAWNYADQDRALMEDQFLAKKLRGTVRLIDERTNQVLDERRQSLMRVPWMTERGTFIHGGNEYTTAMQARLVAGPYARRMANGQLATQFNPKPGSGKAFQVILDPESAQYRLGLGTSQLHLYSLLHDLGHPDEDLEQQWGSDVFQTNRGKYDRRVLPRAYTQLIPAWKQVKDASHEQMAEAVKQALSQTQVNRNVARRTLPNWFDRQKAAQWRAAAFGREVGAMSMEKRATSLEFAPDWAPSELQLLRTRDHIEERAQLSLSVGHILKQAAEVKSAIVKRKGKKWLLLTRDGKHVLGTHDTAQQAYAQEYAIQKSQERQQSQTKAGRVFIQDELLLWAHLYDEQDPDYDKYRKKLQTCDLEDSEVEEILERFQKARAKALTSPKVKLWEERRIAARAWTEEPATPAQAEAGNYPKGTFSYRGLPVTIETAAGSMRRGWDDDGNVTWEVRMRDDYGYVLGTESDRDGDHLDVFLGPDLGSELVFCVDQIDQDTGEFDEHKFILGAHSADQAKDIYLRNFSDGWRAGKITPLTWPQFRHWASSGDSGKALWDTDSIALPQKRASSAAPYYDWDGTLVPRIGGPAGAYLKALRELDALTPLGDSLKSQGPVDLLTARPPMFHPEIRRTAERLGLELGDILHADGPKSKVLGPTGRGLVDDDDDVIAEVNDALGDVATKVAAEFEPDLDEAAMQEAYDAIYGKSKPQLASMSSWPKEWMPPGSDPLGWVNWYKNYLAGTRTDDDPRQIRRWKQFKARHGAQFQKNPTPRRAFALRYWAIDPLKLLPENEREAFVEKMEAYRGQRTTQWLREKTADFALPDLQRLAEFLNKHHSAGIVVDGTADQIEQQIARFLGADDTEASALMSAARTIEQIDTSAPLAAQQPVKVAAADKGCLMAMLPVTDAVRIVKWVQEQIPEKNLAQPGIERESHVTVLYGYDADVRYTEVQAHLPEDAVQFRLGKIKRFPANEHRPDSDVLVVEVESEELQALNAKMKSEFEGRYHNNYPTYTPHLTLAYVKPGASKNLDGHARFFGEIFLCREFMYSTPGAKRRHTFSLE